MEREVRRDVLRARGDLARSLELAQRERLLPEHGVGGGEAQRRVEVAGVLRADPLQQRDRPARTPRGRRASRPCRSCRRGGSCRPGRGASFRTDGRRRRRRRSRGSPAGAAPPPRARPRRAGPRARGPGTRAAPCAGAARRRASGPRSRVSAGSATTSYTSSPPGEDRLRPCPRPPSPAAASRRRGTASSPRRGRSPARRRAGCARRRAPPSRGWCGRRGATLTGASLTPGATPGPTMTSGTCIVDW